MTSDSPQRIAILGSTGSVGRSTLEVAALHPERFEVFALGAATQVDVMLAQCARFKPRFVAMASEVHGRVLAEKLKENKLLAQVLYGHDAMEKIASMPEVDMVMGAIVGAAGLPPCLAAARAGKRLLLANKEALVVGGALFMRAVEEGGATLLPIDSEHSAIFQCLPEDPADWAARIDHIVLTASGGPFRQRDPATFGDITPEQACAHPNWVMGRKISVDSATMMNKALEVIEARWLFNLQPDQIRVVLHPQSIIHSMVVCRDRSVLAQLGTPDMRVPIAYGLSWPQRIESGADLLDFTRLNALTFEEADAQRYPGLQLAWETLKGEAGSTCVLNAANEIAVEAFLARRIRFDQIHRVVVQSLSDCRIEHSATETVEGLLDLDGQARRVASSVVAGLAV